MEGFTQESLFEGETTGRVEPPERGLYLGTSGWSYADWDGTLYPPGTPPAGRLAEYVRHFATVEIDSTFYGTPRRSTVDRWRRAVPAGFLFAAKFPREITHERELEDCEEPARNFVEVMSGLQDKLGPLLVQLPPGFRAANSGRLEEFLAGLPEGFRYAVEVRHRSWTESGLPELLRERGVALTLVDRPEMPRQDLATADFVYIRWLGDRREFPEGHTHPKRDRTEDLEWWSAAVDRFLEEGRTVFAYANNHYENHSPSTLERFMKIRGLSGG
jgi:uncharacterized protein YecE (DUF72 family)